MLPRGVAVDEVAIENYQIWSIVVQDLADNLY
jgi:hypothetical protein